MDISHFFHQIKNAHYSSAFRCSFVDMEFQSERIKGYKSYFLFKCKICSEKISISLEKNVAEDYLPINKAVISGSLAIGMYQIYKNIFITITYNQSWAIIFRITNNR